MEWKLPELNTKSAAALVGAAALAGCGETHHHAKYATTTATNPKPVFAHNVLHNGESVNLEGLHVTIAHNSIVVGQAAMTAFRAAHPKSELEIIMDADNGMKREMIITASTGGGTSVEEDDAGNEVMNCYPIEGPDCSVTVKRGIAKYGGALGGELLKLSEKNKNLRPSGVKYFRLRPESVI